MIRMCMCDRQCVQFAGHRRSWFRISGQHQPICSLCLSEQATQRWRLLRLIRVTRSAGAAQTGHADRCPVQHVLSSVPFSAPPVLVTDGKTAVMYWPAFALPCLQHWSREYLPAGPAHGGYIPAHLSVRDGVSGQGRANLSPP